MKRSLLNFTLISALGISFVGCVQNQPKSTAELMYGKTAEESAVTLQKEMKFPRAITKDITLSNVEIDSNDKGMSVWTYQSKMLPKKGNEDFFLNQEKSLEHEGTKKTIIGNCKELYPFYQNGGKLKMISKWANGKSLQEYTIDKSICDNLN
jgi:hypothetical protein